MRTFEVHKVTALDELKTKVHSITDGCSKPYFRRALESMIETNVENCKIICEYILAEQREF